MYISLLQKEKKKNKYNLIETAIHYLLTFIHLYRNIDLRIYGLKMTQFSHHPLREYFIFSY